MRHLCFHKCFFHGSHTKFVMEQTSIPAPLLSTQGSINGNEDPKITKTRKGICIFLSIFAKDSNSWKAFGGQEFQMTLCRGRLFSDFSGGPAEMEKKR